jgi:hypothetical protein
MRHRPSTERLVEDSRWTRDKRGNWRHKTEAISEVAFCQRATHEKNGWYHAARINAPV